MAAELIGGAFISGAIQLLLERIASPEFINYFRRTKDDSDSEYEALVKKLKTMVTSLSAVLDDADRRQIRDDPKAEAWLDLLQEAVFDADDLIDEIETDVLQRTVQEQFGAATSEVRPTKRLKILNFFSRNDGDMADKIKIILDRLEEIATQIDLLGLKQNLVEVKPWQRTPSSSLVEESEVYGRDIDKEVIIKLLLSDDNGGRDKICVIPIVGMGGIGKTTLAQAVFNHPQARDHFELKAWVCVSEEYDPLRITKDILKSVSNLVCHDITDLNSLQVKLREGLAGKKFLIVLDDVWNESYLDWDNLRTPFIDGAQGSKIIVSTRSDKVADIMGTVGSHKLKVLEEEACWKLFARHAFGSGNSTENPDLERVGREIVLKCKGLPLAVKILGGLLRSTSDVWEWERVAKSDIWELTEKDILPALRLSYYYLPSPLKQCFAYCSIFPTDYEFEKEELILLWMAENLLQDPKGNKKMEEVGCEYFKELVSRSFLQPIYCGAAFVMHDLLVDLAKFVSKNSFLVEDKSSKLDANMTRARHVAYISDSCGPSEKLFDYVFEATNLRTFLPLHETTFTFSKYALDDLFSKLRRLRVLSFYPSRRIENIPDSIGELRHLRYLDLSYTSITCLPKTIINLYNLQTLKLCDCGRLKELPKDFHHLISLRYLDLSGTKIEKMPSSLSLMSSLHTLRLPDSLKEMPTQTSKLKNLETLNFFIVGQDAGKKVGELGELANLRGSLEIRNLENVVNPEDALEAKLRDKKYLKDLIFQWRCVTEASMHEKEVLENLVPNPSLKEIKIMRYGGKEFPSWLGNELFCNIVDVKLQYCNGCVSLPALGQLPSLKTLRIEKMKALVKVGPEFYGNRCSIIKPFPSLEELSFEDMPVWKEWSVLDGDVEAFPNLSSLSLSNCESLAEDLPCFLPSLTKLQIYGCQRLVSKLPKMQKLSELILWNSCEKMMMESMEALESLPKTLTRLEFGGCENVESLWASSLFSLPTLTSLTLDTCKKLKFLPEEMHNLLPSLEYLYLCNCMELESFPTSGLPSTLSKLIISDCDKLLASRKTWNLHTLSNLKTFQISERECEDMESFPEEGLLPTTLTVLILSDMKCVERLNGKGLQQLNSLKELEIWNCKNLKALTEEEGLPSSLDHLCINGSPLVEEKCKRERGEYWNIISHIPNIFINRTRI